MRTRARIATLALLVTVCVISALVLPQGAGSQAGDGGFAEGASTPEDGTFTAAPAEAPTGTPIDVSGDGCIVEGTPYPGDAVLVSMGDPESDEAVASVQLAVAEDGTWSGAIAAPLGTPAGELQIAARCVAPEQDLVAYAPQAHEVTGEGTGDEPMPPESTLEAPDPALGVAPPAEAAASVGAAGTDGTHAGLPNRTFAAPIEPLPAYDGQTTCSPTDKPGTLAFRAMVMEAFPYTGLGGISRSCSQGGQSEHKEGRAWDWGVNVSNSAQAAAASQLTDWLLATDARGNRYANARRLGVMYIIWNRHMFRLYRPQDGWRPYTGSSPHTDHVHLSFTRAGGNGTTTWWTSPPDPCNGQTHQPFCDVSPSHQFRTEILWAANNDIAEGWPDTSFRPLEGVSRQAMAAFMYRLAGSPSFTVPSPTFSDVGTNHLFRREIEWLNREGISTGYDDGRFRPLSSISRQAMSAFMYRAAGEPPYAAPSTPSFRDAAVGRPFYREIHWMASTGISEGYPDGTFRPDARVSRQAMAAFLLRLDERF